MGFLSKLFNSKKKDEGHEEQKKFENENAIQNSNKLRTGNLGFEISLDNKGDINFSSLPVGVSTGSTAKDFYVYEWFINETGEIFYVGKGKLKIFMRRWNS